MPTCILGVYVLDNITSQVKTVIASRTVLATGGIGELWQRTTNPVGARGDGIAMAHRAGAQVINMEYIQFHPTAYRGKKSFLVSEAVRGEGAFLVNTSYKRVMTKYNPAMMELAPRDEVARALYDYQINNLHDQIYLDISPIKKKGINFEERFPQIFTKCVGAGLDLNKENLIPVSPAAHYHCGGIRVDEKGATNLSRLYAIGECACTGIHGANRLASTSLLECLVWAKSVANQFSPLLKMLNVAELKLWQIPNWDDTFGQKSLKSPNAMKRNLRKWMQVNVGVVRNGKQLSQALQAFRRYFARVENIYYSSRISDEIIDLRNSLQVAILVNQAALRNKESKGCHYRDDENQKEN